jgi:hypothetical protein
MNKIEVIRNACLQAKAKGIKLLTGGHWFDLTGKGESKIISCCAIGAVLLTDSEFTIAEDPSRPGYLKKACEMLETDWHWIFRFWMGFDRGHQVLLVNDKDKEIKDDVSAFGIQLAKELADKK